MEIEQFVALSSGEWKSMRSGHSLAFKVFEEIISTIKIEVLSLEDPEIKQILNRSPYNHSQASSPFKIEWEAESDWEPNSLEPSSKGYCYLIPFPKSLTTGHLIRSQGYLEKIYTTSSYSFLEDGTFYLKTKYNHSLCDEKIWFASENVRCRSSIIYSSDGKSILQTSFASEVRKINQ